MEKVIYVVAFVPGSSPADLGERLLRELPVALRTAGAHRVAVNVSDADVAAAEPLRMSSSPRPASALVSVWVDSAVDHLRAPVDAAVVEALTDAVVHAYLVTESVPLPMPADRHDATGRVDGYAQVAFLQRRPDLTVEEFLDTWLNDHTHVAIELQDTFSYVQNVVARVLTTGAPPWHAIVEECFPMAAMADPHVFYDAVGDDALLASRQRDMFRSVERFLDLTAIDVVPTSRYDR